MASCTPCSRRTAAAAEPVGDRLARAPSGRGRRRRRHEHQHRRCRAWPPRRSRAGCPPLAPLAGAAKKPPRHRTETFRPASRDPARASATPSRRPVRHRPIPGCPARRSRVDEPRAAASWSAVIWLRLSRRRRRLTRPPPARAGAASRAAASSGSRSRPARSASTNSSARCRTERAALQPADHREVRLVAGEPGQEHDARLVVRGRRREDCRDSGTVGASSRVVAGRGRPSSSACSAAAAAGAIASKMPSSASL